MRNARRHRLTLPLAALTLAACGLHRPLPPPNLSTVGETFAPTNVSLGDALGVASVLSFDATTRSAELQRIGSLGVHLVRRDFLWQNLEPAAGMIDFSDEDTAVDDSVGSGMTTIGILAYNNAWTAGGDVDTAPDPQAFAAFAEETALHYAGRVDTWEIWNEPNVGYKYWKPREDGAAYARLLAAASAAIKRGNPSATVLLGGLLYHGESGADDAATFLEAAFTADPALQRWFDVLALHAYALAPPQAAPEADAGGEEPVGQMVSRMRALLKHYGANRSVWVTGVGWPVYGTVDEPTQAAFSVRAAVELMAAGADRVCLYTLDDGPNPTAVPPTDAFGLFRNDASPKPAATALTTLLTLDSSLALTADNSADGLRRYVFSSASTPELDVVYATDGTAHALDVPAGASVLALDGTASTATTVDGTPLLVVSH